MAREDTRDDISLLRASYDSTVPGHNAEVQAVGVNTVTGETYFCGYLFSPNPPPGTEQVGLLFKNDAGGSGVSAALFSFAMTHNFNCGGVAVDESTSEVYVAGWATDDNTGFDTSLLVKLMEDVAGQTFNIEQAYTGDDPAHPGNNRTTGVQVDEITFQSWWSSETHYGDAGIPEADYGGVTVFNQAFDTASQNLNNYEEFDAAGFDSISVRNGAGALAVGGWVKGVMHGNFRLPVGSAFNNDGTFIAAWRSADVADGGLRGQLSRTCWDNQGSDVLGVGTGDDLTTRFLTQIRVTVNPFVFLAFSTYGDTDNLPPQSAGCAFDDTNKAYISGAGYRIQGGPPHRATVLAIMPTGVRIQTYEFGGTGPTPDWVDGLVFNPIRLNLSAGGGTTNAGWSTDTTTFQGPQDGFDADLSKN